MKDIVTEEYTVITVDSELQAMHIIMSALQRHVFVVGQMVDSDNKSAKRILTWALDRINDVGYVEK